MLPRLALLAAAALLLAGCAEGGSTGSSAQTLQVLAAASLSGSFDDLAADFEAAHPEVEVEIVYDSSATLAQQVTEGAPADVLATADLDTMRRVLDAGEANESTTFAGNTAVLVTPRDNPAGLRSFADLDAGRASYVVCVDTAPCGKVASALLSENGIRAEPRSFEDNVKAVLHKVTSGEVDAGIVYLTDALAAASKVTQVQIPGADAHPTGYAIAVVRQSGRTDLAQAFVDLVLSPDGQEVLREAGFTSAG